MTPTILRAAIVARRIRTFVGFLIAVRPERNAVPVANAPIAATTNPRTARDARYVSGSFHW